MNEEQTEGLWTKDFYDFFTEAGIYNLGTGPKWELDKQKICDFDDFLCESVQWYGMNDEGVDIKTLFHYA